MDIQDKINQIKKLNLQLIVERNKAYEQVQKIKLDINQRFRELFDFENKYIKLQDDTDEERFTYMYCECIHIGDNLSGHEEITFRGYGFSYSITNYQDDTWLQWDEMLEKSYFTSQGFANILELITVISADEFNSEFKKMMNEIFVRHNKNMEINKD